MTRPPPAMAKASQVMLLAAAQAPDPQLVHEDPRVPAQQHRAGVGAGLGQDERPGGQDRVEHFLLLAVPPAEHPDAQHQREDHDHAHGHQRRGRQHRGGHAVPGGQHGGRPAGNGHGHADQRAAAADSMGFTVIPPPPAVGTAVEVAETVERREVREVGGPGREITDRVPFSLAAGSISDHGYSTKARSAARGCGSVSSRIRALHVPVGDDVHVERPRPPAHLAHPVVLVLHRLAVRAAAPGRSRRGLHGDHHVEEVRLARRAAHGLGLDHRRDGEEPHLGPVDQVGDGGGQGVVPLPRLLPRASTARVYRVFMCAPGQTVTLTATSPNGTSMGALGLCTVMSTAATGNSCQQVFGHPHGQGLDEVQGLTCDPVRDPFGHFAVVGGVAGRRRTRQPG